MGYLSLQSRHARHNPGSSPGRGAKEHDKSVTKVAGLFCFVGIVIWKRDLEPSISYLDVTLRSQALSKKWAHGSYSNYMGDKK